ncbi:MAG: methyltransferase [Deltaproteobacteria bacterium]
MTRPAANAAGCECTPIALGRFDFQQGKRGLRLTTDTVLLAQFVQCEERPVSIIDLGCGYGPIPLLLSDAFDDCHITGVEIDAEAAAICSRNVEVNGLKHRISILNADIRALPDSFAEGSFPIVVSNPPYMKIGSARISPDRQRAIARSEQTCTLRDIITTSRHLAGNAGRIFFVYVADRFDEMIEEARYAGLAPVRVRFVHTAPNRPPERFLIEMRP